MTEKTPLGFWKTVGAVFIALTMAAGLWWIAWKSSSSYHRAEIASLRQTLSAVTEAYDVLARKMDGLFEPRLLTEDTLRTEKPGAFRVLGARMKFRVYTVGHYFSVSYGRFGNSVDLILRPGERHGFEFEQKPYYVVFDFLGDGDSLIRAQLYELEPLYKPASR